MKKLLIATSNPGKQKEILAFLPKDLPYEIVNLRDFPRLKEPEETGTTFEENAELKARFYGQETGLLTLSEDSGFILSAFPEKFGIHTKREFATKDDMDWLTQFMDLLDGVEDRRGAFYSSVSVFDPQRGEAKTVLGQITGVIVDFPQAPIEKGIPVSSVFTPEGSDLVYSAMTKQQKAASSHRGQAMKEILGSGVLG